MEAWLMAVMPVLCSSLLLLPSLLVPSSPLLALSPLLPLSPCCLLFLDGRVYDSFLCFSLLKFLYHNSLNSKQEFGNLTKQQANDTTKHAILTMIALCKF